MSVLVLAEHNNKEVKSSTYNCIFAAAQIDPEVEVLVIGSDCQHIANQLSNTANVTKVALVNKPEYENPIAEIYEPIILKLSSNYSHILGPATTYGKNIFPRISVKLDVSQVSDVIKIIDKDTFVRPIYAGNALATVKSKDKVKIITVRPTSFDAAPKEGGSGNIEEVTPEENISSTEFVSREESSSDRPELSAARVVISGGRGLQSADNFKLLNEIADNVAKQRYVLLDQ